MDSLHIIRLDRINRDDRRFSVSYPMESPLLLESIAKAGVIQPVLLIIDGPTFTVVTGCRRIEAAMKLGSISVPAIVTDRLSGKDALLCAIHDNLSRGFNAVEKALALSKMVRMGFPLEEVKETMTLLGLKTHEKILRTFIALADSKESLKSFVVSRNLSVTNIEGLMRFDNGEMEQLLSLFTQIHTTEGYLREILKMAALMRLKDGRIDFQGLSGSENAEDLRTKLKHRTFPMLSSLQEQLETLRRRCALPPNMDIKVDPSFEKEYIDIDIRVKNINDVEQALEKLGKVMEDGSLRSMLELTKG
ncbi:MAG: ParB/RepB/Spo0J family partition protein [Syntrophobacterales bacterium]|jgi:hypothetical protein|nr:ParB/RepB/Spo0J family partition protein [Syntrophobacterales bacterium]